jgi:hypothetical protein
MSQELLRVKRTDKGVAHEPPFVVVGDDQPIAESNANLVRATRSLDRVALSYEDLVNQGGIVHDDK